MNQKKAYDKFVQETRWLCNNLYRADIAEYANDTISNLFTLFNYGCISVNFCDMFVRRVLSAMHVDSIHDF